MYITNLKNIEGYKHTRYVTSIIFRTMILKNNPPITKDQGIS